MDKLAKTHIDCAAKIAVLERAFQIMVEEMSLPAAASASLSKIEIVNTYENLAAKINVLEFTTEVFAAQLLARFSPQVSEFVKSDFLEKIKMPALPAKLDNEQLEALVVDQTRLFAERFVSNVSSRETKIRSKAAGT